MKHLVTKKKQRTVIKREQGREREIGSEGLSEGGIHPLALLPLGSILLAIPPPPFNLRERKRQSWR